MQADNKAEKSAQTLAEPLIDCIRQFCAQVHPNRSTPTVTLASTLDRDLALDSLGRVHLVASIETEFGVRLPESTFAQADTVDDLLVALSVAQAQPRRRPPATTMTSAASNETNLLIPPDRAATLAEALQWHAQRTPTRTHIELYSDNGDGDKLTYQALWDLATKIAGNLQERGLHKGETVAIMLPTGVDYFCIFYGTLLAGAIPVSLYPPAQRVHFEDHVLRHRAILENCQARFLITAPEAGKYAKSLRALSTSLHDILQPATLRGVARWQPPLLTGEDVAFIQYTSGTTGDPKGVVLTHANLLANIRAMGAVVGANSRDVFVSWLPLYHDMGLIGAWLGSLYFGCHFVCMSPLTFLARPERWLRAIHRHRGTLSAAPNFAYELCLSRLRDSDLQGLDLTSWRAAFNGAEPVRSETLRRFCERFAAYGFRSEAMMPVYGLAESCVGLAFPPMTRGPRIDRIRRSDLALKGRAIPAAATDSDVASFPSCGFPLPAHEIRIVDDADREAADRSEGRIQFRGPSATQGYFHNETASKRLISEAWLDSGDMGYIADGELYITGRRKDLIIRGGRNLYPQELEEAVGEIVGIRKGRVVVLGTEDTQTGTEKLIVVAETRVSDVAARNSLRSRIQDLATEFAGGPADDVVLAEANTVLKTSSGKLRRSACRELYEKGRLGRQRQRPWQQLLRLMPLSAGPLWRRARERAATTAFAAYGWSLFAVLSLLACVGVLVLPTVRWRWQVLRGLLRTLAWATATPLHLKGAEFRPRADTPCVIVANHASYLDALALIAVLPNPVTFVAKTELRSQFAVRLLLERLDTEFVDRFQVEQSLRDAQRLAARVGAGHSLLFFPEGTFTRRPGLLSFRLGAFLAAAAAGTPLLPVAIRGTRSILRSDSWFPRRGAINIALSAPISLPTSEKGDSRALWNNALRLRNAAREIILAQTGEPDLGREGSPVEPPAVANPAS